MSYMSITYYLLFLGGQISFVSELALLCLGL